jgi:predicted GNAT family N-acyltransferase
MDIVVVDPHSALYQQVFHLREEVLRKPLGMSLHNEDLSRDYTDTILAGLVDGRVVACLMLHPKSENTVQLRQMAVYAHLQGQGLGRQLVQAAEVLAADRGYTKMILHARQVALGFYQSMGYIIVGDEFAEVGIPHYAMEKSL